MAIITKLAYKGHTIIIVTHNLLEVEKYADNFALFNHGKLLKSGPVHQMSYKNHYQISSILLVKNFKSIRTFYDGQWLCLSDGN
ncbi:MAG: hypothetical protein ACLUSV_03380 [Streptococcus sp.]